MTAFAGGEVRHHELELVAATKEHELTPAAQLPPSGGDQLGEFGVIDHAVAGVQGRRGRVAAPGSNPDVERHRHGVRP